MPHPIVYIEIPSSNVAQSKQFYSSLFGWTYDDYGPDYAAINDAGILAGFNGNHAADRTAAPLPVLQTDDLEAMLTRVTDAGGTITLPIFAFPGGRRFHFKDPSGQELAVLQPA